jgi:uncharacterized lipoprotein YmbA
MIRRCLQLVTSLMLATVVGCSVLSSQADPTKYYVLSPQTSPAPKPPPIEQSVGIGPLTMPDHLDQQLVTRLADEEISISDVEEWGEPLRDSFPRVLQQNLIGLLGTERVVVYPWDLSNPPDLAVRIDLLHFERTTKGVADLRARWSIEQVASRKALATEETRVMKPIMGTDTRDAVAALDAAVGALSDQIAAEVRRIVAPPAIQTSGRR